MEEMLLSLNGPWSNAALTAEEMKELAALEDRGGKSKIDDTK